MLVNNFLNEAQCEYIMNYKKMFFVKAQGFDPVELKSNETEHRTNYTYYDVTNHFDYVRREAFDIAKDFFWFLPDFSINNLEMAQIQKYGIGEEYRHHHDYFTCHDYIFLNDRVASIIVYLNDDFEGGETDFPKINLKIKPKAGMALYFDYKYSNELNDYTLHAGLPILKGEKWIMTIWVRKYNVHKIDTKIVKKCINNES